MKAIERNLQDATELGSWLNTRERWRAFYRVVRVLIRKDPGQDISVDFAAWAIFRNHPTYADWYLRIRAAKIHDTDRLECDRFMRDLFYREQSMVYVHRAFARRDSLGRLTLVDRKIRSCRLPS